MYTRVHHGMLYTQEYKAYFIMEAVKASQSDFDILSVHFDFRSLDFVVLAYPTKRRLTIGISRIDLRLIQRDLLFQIPSQNLKRI